MVAWQRNVQALIDRYGLHDWPGEVPIRQVARDEGWLVQFGEITPALGYAVVLGTVRVMVINEAVSRAYQRFAIAHELGHVLAGDPGRLQLCQPEVGAFGAWLLSAAERRANQIAALLLVPPAALGWDATTREIAAQLVVPEELVTLRQQLALR